MYDEWCVCDFTFPTPFLSFLSLLSMNCKTCLCYSGISVDHSADSSPCPLLPILRCRRCHTRGHTAAHCGEQWNHLERPMTLEELIPADIRMQWDITTSTDLSFTEPRGERDCKFEIHVSRQDKVMRDFMKKNNIQSTNAAEANLQRIRDWAMRSGLRLVITP